MEEETEYVNGIEVLAVLCDEHGLQHWDRESPACETHVFIDKAGNPHECWDSPHGMVNVVISMTPEQAVMLGTETCKEVKIDRYWRGCGECGYIWEHMYAMGKCTRPNFCPNCGKRVTS